MKMTSKGFNLRDRFGDWWDKASPVKRGIFRVFLIAIFFGLPILNNPIIDTPNTSFESVLFYPLVMFAVMAVGLNVVVGKSGILDLGYVAFFAIVVPMWPISLPTIGYMAYWTGAIMLRSLLISRRPLTIILAVT